MKIQMDANVTHKKLTKEEIEEIINKSKDIVVENNNEFIEYIETDDKGVPLND